MYVRFYNLTELPFTLTPSPRFLYLGDAHRGALALLTYGVVERKGFILLTGEAGTGKTTMVQALLSRLDETVHVIHLANPLLSPGEFMDYLASSAFHKKLHVRSKAHFLLAFEEFLRECLYRKKTVILIIDEAQNLSFELLEEIRLLSNMESADEKLITIFLVGQPELEEKLGEQRCFSLLQRITHRYDIPPLDLAGTEGYIASRLLAVGAPDPDELFPENAVEAIFCYSRGYPRLINTLADNALRLGWEKGEKQITVPLVKESFEQTAVGRAAVKSGRRWKAPRVISRRKHLQLIHSWRWAALVCVLIGLLAFGMSRDGRKIVGQLLAPDPMSHYMPSENASFGKITVRIKDSRESERQHLEDSLKEGLSAAIRHALKETQTGMLERSKDTENSLQGNQNQPSSPLTVARGVICRGVTYGRPLLAGESFPGSVGTLYCFTKIVGAQSPTQITHVWYFGDTKKSRAKLKVKSSSWRTYSARTIKTSEVGEWRVAVLGPGGEVLKSLGFKITP